MEDYLLLKYVVGMEIINYTGQAGARFLGIIYEKERTLYFYQQGNKILLNIEDESNL